MENPFKIIIKNGYLFSLHHYPTWFWNYNLKTKLISLVVEHSSWEHTSHGSNPGETFLLFYQFFLKIFFFRVQYYHFPASLKCHRFKSRLRMTFFHPHPPIMFIKWICFVFWCLVGYIGWKLAESGGKWRKLAKNRFWVAFM